MVDCTVCSVAADVLVFFASRVSLSVFVVRLVAICSVADGTGGLSVICSGVGCTVCSVAGCIACSVADCMAGLLVDCFVVDCVGGFLIGCCVADDVLCVFAGGASLSEFVVWLFPVL